MSYSNYLEDRINDAVCRNTSLAISAVYVKLHTGDPGEAGTSNAATETTRKVVTFAASSSGTSTSNADATWTSVAGSETYSHVSLWDASTSGNCLGSGALTASRAVVAGDSFSIPSGSLTFSSD